MALEILSYKTDAGDGSIVDHKILLTVNSRVTEFTPTITVTEGATVTPASGTKVTLDGHAKTISYTVSKTGEESVQYLALIGIQQDTSVYGMAHIDKVGWFAARTITGDLDAYVKGGIPVPLGTFKPKHVISVQIDGGFTSFFDIDTGKLRVYKSKGTEATSSDLTDVKYTLMLME